MQTINSLIALLLAIPLGLLLSKFTKDEKNIYSKPPYFPIFLWALAISAAIFYTLNLKTALTLTFLFITIFTWQNADKIIKK